LVVLAIIGGAIVVAAAVLFAVVTLSSRVSKRRRVHGMFDTLGSLRSASGRPFFPETPEERRREERILAGWDPTYDDDKGADPDRW
jgi:hypothetical protein